MKYWLKVFNLWFNNKLKYKIPYNEEYNKFLTGMLNLGIITFLDSRRTNNSRNYKGTIKICYKGIFYTIDMDTPYSEYGYISYIEHSRTSNDLYCRPSLKNMLLLENILKKHYHWKMKKGFGDGKPNKEKPQQEQINDYIKFLRSERK